jgi:hypothetical protein
MRRAINWFVVLLSIVFLIVGIGLSGCGGDPRDANWKAFSRTRWEDSSARTWSLPRKSAAPDVRDGGRHVRAD